MDLQAWTEEKLIARARAVVSREGNAVIALAEEVREGLVVASLPHGVEQDTPSETL